MNKKNYKFLSLNNLSSPLAYLGLFLSINWMFGLFQFSFSSILSSLDAFYSFVFPIVTTMSWLSIKYLKHSIPVYLSTIVSYYHRQHTHRVRSLLVNTIVNAEKKVLRIILMISLLIAFSFGFANGLWNHFLQANIEMIISFQAVLVWFMFLSVVFLVFLSQRLISIILKKKVRIKIFEIEQFRPANNLVIACLVLPILIISITGFFAFLPPIGYSEIVTASFFTFLCFVLIGNPILLVNRRLNQTRNIALKNIDKSLRTQLKNSADKDSMRLVDDLKRLELVSDLNFLRSEIQSLKLWSVDIPFTLKIIALAFIPIFTMLVSAFYNQALRSIGF